MLNISNISGGYITVIDPKLAFNLFRLFFSFVYEFTKNVFVS